MGPPMTPGPPGADFAPWGGMAWGVRPPTQARGAQKFWDGGGETPR